MFYRVDYILDETTKDKTVVIADAEDEAWDEAIDAVRERAHGRNWRIVDVQEIAG